LTLMVGISGVRGIVGADLTPEIVARYAAAFGVWAAGGRRNGPRRRRAVVLGRDARTSGPMFAAAAAAGLVSVGCDVVDLGLVPTPTAQLAVEFHRAAGGIVLTASHNPIEWNALKFVGPDGLFLDAAAGARVAISRAPGRPTACRAPTSARWGRCARTRGRSSGICGACCAPAPPTWRGFGAGASTWRSTRCAAPAA